MRPSFERNLRNLERTEPVLENQFKDEFEDGFDLTKLSEPTRLKVEGLQANKRVLIERLHELLRKIDNGEVVEIPGRKMYCVQVSSEGRMEAQDSEGKLKDVSDGQLLTDGVWGIGYQLSSDLPRSLRKEYVLSETRRLVGILLNKQILLVESELNQNPAEQSSYKAVLERTEKSENIFSWDDGHIAEAMVHGQISKWIRGYGLPLEIVATDIYEDVTNKLDFILRKPHYSLGLQVEAEDTNTQIGIQFTLQHRKDSMVGKKGTINRVLERGLRSEYKVDDIALVNMHPAYVKRAVNSWKKHKQSGGPDDQLELAARVDLFEKICSNLFTQAEIDKWRTQIFGLNSENIKRLKT